MWFSRYCVTGVFMLQVFLCYRYYVTDVSVLQTFLYYMCCYFTGVSLVQVSSCYICFTGVAVLNKWCVTDVLLQLLLCYRCHVTGVVVLQVLLSACSSLPVLIQDHLLSSWYGDGYDVISETDEHFRGSLTAVFNRLVDGGHSEVSSHYSRLYVASAGEAAALRQENCHERVHLVMRAARPSDLSGLCHSPVTYTCRVNKY